MLKKLKNLKKLKDLNKIKKVIIIAFALIIIILLIIISIKITVDKKSRKPEIITQVNLTQILNVSNLSTVELVYNGITDVQNTKNPDKIDYYVSYESKISAGFDFKKINLTVDNNQKIISVELPAMTTTVNVDIASLDFIFENKKTNKDTVLQDAYKKCIEDATVESSTKSDIYETAKQNAENTIEALIMPFVNEIDSEYKIVFN